MNEREYVASLLAYLHVIVQAWEGRKMDLICMYDNSRVLTRKVFPLVKYIDTYATSHS